MAKTNVIQKSRAFTHEGARATKAPNALEALRRSVMACMLFEDTFYEDGLSVADRIAAAAEHVPLADVVDLAVEARRRQHLRHAPLWLMVAALNHPGFRGQTKGYSSMDNSPRSIVAAGIDEVCQRADDMGELVALYWKGGKRPLAAALKDGLARAFGKFDAYRLAKYASRGAIRLRDVMFLVHPKPRDEAQAALWKALADDKLEPADTWEVALSGGADKRATFERLLGEGKLGGLATLRNLRNMQAAGVPKAKVHEALVVQAGKSGILPFQYVAAARAVPSWEDAIEAAMLRALGDAKRLPGKTVLLVDKSGSMSDPLSAKSELRRIDAAAALAMLLREVCEEVEIAAFDNHLTPMPPRRGFALRDVIGRASGGTDTRLAVSWAVTRGADRIVIITDEQSATSIPLPGQARGYVMNVASNQHGIGYGAWTHVSGFSENLVRYIAEVESAR
jgi:hypothetical protein